MMVSGGEGILALVADPFHRVGHAVLRGCHLPSGVGIEHIGDDDTFVYGQVPVGCVLFSIKIRVCLEKGHLPFPVPESPLIVTVHDLGPRKAVDIVAIWRAADIDIRLPYIAACSRVAVLQEVAAFVFDLVVDREMCVPAEEFISSLELIKELQERAEPGTAVMSFLAF